MWKYVYLAAALVIICRYTLASPGPIIVPGGGYVNTSGQPSGNIDMNGNLLYDSTGPMCIHDAACGASGHSLGVGDLIVDGMTEFNGKTYFDDDPRLANNVRYRWGTTTETIMEFDTTNGSFLIGADITSHNIILLSGSDVAVNLGLANSTDPHLVIASAGIDSDQTEYIAFYHDGTEGVIQVGTGLVYFPNGIEINANRKLNLGNNAESSIEYETTQTADSITIGVGSGSNTLLIAQNADLTTNFYASTPTTPTVHIHNADITDSTKHLELSHDGTNGVLDVGTGVVSIPDGTTTAGTYASTASENGNTVANAANTACTTTCGALACWAGIDTGTGFFVTCSDATADSCLCLP